MQFYTFPAQILAPFRCKVGSNTYVGAVFRQIFGSVIIIILYFATRQIIICTRSPTIHVILHTQITEYVAARAVELLHHHHH